MSFATLLVLCASAAFAEPVEPAKVRLRIHLERRQLLVPRRWPRRWSGLGLQPAASKSRALVLMKDLSEPSS